MSPAHLTNPAETDVNAASHTPVAVPCPYCESTETEQRGAQADVYGNLDAEPIWWCRSCEQDWAEGNNP
jgi:hypothetical protein